MKTGKCSLKRGIIALDFGEKYASLLPILEKAWWTRDQRIRGFLK